MNRKASGTRKERELMKLLEAEGYECTRSGASLGRYDVVALRRNDDHPHSLWIQVKYGTRKYIYRCVNQWLQDSMPPYHHEVLYCYIRNDGWYELVDDQATVRLIKRFNKITRTRKKGASEMKLSDVMEIWEILHVKDTGDIGFCDLDEAIKAIVGVENDTPGCLEVTL